MRALLERHGDGKQAVAGIDVMQFLVGMAALDPCTVHAGPWNVERTHYIFRAYDANQSGQLEFSEFVDMVRKAGRFPCCLVNLWFVYNCIVVPGPPHAPWPQRRLELRTFRARFFFFLSLEYNQNQSK